MAANTPSTETFLVPALTRAIVLSFCSVADPSRLAQPAFLKYWQIRFRAKSVPIFPYNNNVECRDEHGTDRTRAFTDNATAMLEMGVNAAQSYDYNRWAQSPFYITDTSYEAGEPDTQRMLTFEHGAAQNIRATLVCCTDANMTVTIENNTFSSISIMKDSA
ncbi:MAG: hypothetical protein AAFQ34_15405 [Pseudomonadota bacterium]